MKSEHHTGRLIMSLVACLIPGYVTLYLFTTSIPKWYSGLKKPGFVPPDFIVFYAIILIFCLLGLALYTIWNAGLSNREVRTALRLFILFMVLYFFWFVAFFYFQAVFFALIVMVMVIAVMICMIVQVLWSAVVSAVFLVPCLIMMLIFCFANLQIVLMNPGLPIWGSVI
ncbi:MAG: tryptophan-rich sensory protein [Methanoregula sp.]|jgi:tryptophan-rich sensory protein|uniref:TspO/MBR family protein n=1 Tax=Methanoregula sp. TaxID=2052170 RepID=UPI003C7557CD